MARLRYVKTLEQVEKAARSNPEFLSSTIRSIRAVYETEPAIVAAVLPPPLEPTDRPEISVVSYMCVAGGLLVVELPVRDRVRRSQVLIPGDLVVLGRGRKDVQVTVAIQIRGKN